MIRVTCPHCGSEDIEEINVVEYNYWVKEWEVENGRPEPVDYYADRCITDTIRRVDQDDPRADGFWCRGCSREVHQLHLVVEETP